MTPIQIAYFRRRAEEEEARAAASAVPEAARIHSELALHYRRMVAAVQVDLSLAAEQLAHGLRAPAEDYRAMGMPLLRN